ncbi:unnamed protein product [Polarella glacialis]|uniref:Adenosine deaminase n=1 Tax=Polarella glacialis TaxID=89957 RepID=A0A813HIY8_POLGL|nr:unnamed protein product [Polarella glacialis]
MHGRLVFVAVQSAQLLRPATTVRCRLTANIASKAAAKTCPADLASVAAKTCPEDLEAYERQLLQWREDLLKCGMDFQSLREILQAVQQSDLQRFFEQLPKGVDNHVHLLGMGKRSYLMRRLAAQDYDGAFPAFWNPQTGMILVAKHASAGYVPLPDPASSEFQTLLEFLTMQSKQDDSSGLDPVSHAWEEFEKCFDRIEQPFFFEPFFRAVVLPHIIDDLRYHRDYGVELRMNPCDKLWSFPSDRDASGQKLLELLKDVDDFHIVVILTFNKANNEANRKNNWEKARSFLNLHRLFPDMVRAFDFVGCEDKGVQLKELKDIILYMRRMSKFELKLALHAGETSWNDDTVTPTTTNSKYALQQLEPGPDRLAHVCTVNRDFKVLDLLMRRAPEVPVEICITSNLILKYCPLLNHHVTILESSQHPFVLGA